jgi:ectoine hydroxylase-related dioxygenase (phytanoyl-CoA dioxygenase family)
MIPSGLHIDGYMILRKWTPITPALLDLANNKSAEAEAIFNDNPAHRRNDAKRRQVDLSARHPVIQPIRAALQKANPAHTIHNFVLLVSRPGCRRQAAHTDYVPTPELLRASNSEMPLLFLLALEDNTTLEVWPQSHLIMHGHRGGPAIQRQTVHLSAGDAILFRGDLVHAGSAYERQNMRIHAYLDSPAVPRDPNQTYIIYKHAAPSLRDLIVEETSPQ